ncbi:MAG: dihydroorotate dehydrogenase electron transfer subunit [Clostridia bacterium]
MIKQLQLINKRQLNEKVYELTLQGIDDIKKSGEFINISVDGFYLRRPISICDYNKKDSTIKIIVRVVGGGTKSICDEEKGKVFNCLTGLGNGFDISKRCCKSVFLGGGIGIAPLYYAVKQQLTIDDNFVVALGFNSEKDAFYIDEFKALCDSTIVSTMDGSVGFKGLITQAVESTMLECRYVYACGPMPMMKSIAQMKQFDNGQVSLEQRFGCGYGACMGCSIMTKSGSKRVCKDGPVFDIKDIIW